jgi:hypothetical protein
MSDEEEIEVKSRGSLNFIPEKRSHCLYVGILWVNLLCVCTFSIIIIITRAIRCNVDTFLRMRNALCSVVTCNYVEQVFLLSFFCSLARAFPGS